MIYIAAPYMHCKDSVRYARYKAATKYAAHLASQGKMVFSPLTHSVGILGEQHDGIPESYWLDLDLAILPCCDELHVLMLDGWQGSAGVEREMEAASFEGIPIKLIHADTYNVVSG